MMNRNVSWAPPRPALWVLACGWACSSPSESAPTTPFFADGMPNAAAGEGSVNSSTLAPGEASEATADDGAGNETANGEASSAEVGDDRGSSNDTGSPSSNEAPPTDAELSTPASDADPEATAPADTAPPVAPAAAPLCTAKTRVDSPLVADFESYDGTLEPGQFTFYFGTTATGGGALAGLFSFDDLTGTSSRLRLLSGRTGGWGASFEIAQAREWGGGTGLWFNCVDASAFRGISFWVRGTTGSGTFSLTPGFLATTPPDPEDPRGGGTCTGGPEACVSAALNDIPLTLDWTLIEVPWSSFTGGLVDGQPFVPNGDELTGLTFGLPLAYAPDPSFVDNPNDPEDLPEFLPVPGDIIFQFDDVRFMEP